MLSIDGAIGPYKVNGYILYDKDSREAVIFDTANDSKAVLEFKRQRITVKIYFPDALPL